MTALFKNEDIKIGLPNIFVKSNLVDMDFFLKSRKKVFPTILSEREKIHTRRKDLTNG